MSRLRALLSSPRAPWAIIGFAFAVRLVVLALLAHTPLEGDALSYHQTTLKLLSGQPYEPHWPPGLPFYLSVAYRIFGAREIVGRVAMLPVFGLFCALVLGLGRRLGGPRAAVIALAVFAIAPIFVWASVAPLTQMLNATLALGAVYAAERVVAAWQKGRGEPAGGRALLLLGICLGWLLLTRPPNAIIVGSVPLYLLWRTRRWEALAIPAAVVAICVGAWTLKTWKMTGRLVFINDANAQNIYYGNNPWTPLYRTWWFGSHKDMSVDPNVPAPFMDQLREINHAPAPERSPLFTKMALTHIREHPGLFVVRTAARVRTFVAFDTFTSAQVAKANKKLGGITLLADAALFLFLSVLAIFYPAAMRAGHDPLSRAEPPAGDDRPAESDAGFLVRLLLLVAVAYAIPYFLVFSHPTFHFTAVPLVGLLGAAAGARLLDTGLGPVWSALTSRSRWQLVSALVVFAAIQAEWVYYLTDRVR